MTSGLPRGTSWPPADSWAGEQRPRRSQRLPEGNCSVPRSPSFMRRVAPVFVVLGVWLFTAAETPRSVQAQAPASPTRVLVIDGGTLIDGSGGAAMRGAQI